LKLGRLNEVHQLLKNTENEAIAKMLDYSVSTIYTYKARIKSRALVPANDFERKIMEIEFIDKPVAG
jgi:transposase